MTLEEQVNFRCHTCPSCGRCRLVERHCRCGGPAGALDPQAFQAGFRGLGLAPLDPDARYCLRLAALDLGRAGASEPADCDCALALAPVRGDHWDAVAVERDAVRVCALHGNSLNDGRPFSLRAGDPVTVASRVYCRGATSVPPQTAFHRCVCGPEGCPPASEGDPLCFGPPDAGAGDAGPPDAAGVDSGGMDGGGARDAGPRDAGPRDAGPRDVGSADVGSADSGSARPPRDL
jgi:hypothetical protein